MIHYMLNTGEMQPEPQSNTSPQAIELMSRIYSPGRHRMPIEGYQAEIIRTRAGYFALIMRDETEHPSLIIAVAEDAIAARHLWQNVLEFCTILLGSDDVSTNDHQFIQPKPAPWYATLLLQADCDERLYLSDLCRHLAWGWVEHQRRRTKRALAAAHLRRKLAISLLDSSIVVRHGRPL